MRTFLMAASALLAAAAWAHTPPATNGPVHAAQTGHHDGAPTSSIKPSAIIPYGNGSSQHVELYLPKGPGPFPVVAFIHGGCFQSNRPSMEEIRPAYARMAREGIAVWGIEYRRVDEPGGAYPGMFEDVAAATDLLVREASRYRLDLSRAIVAGHSAGGPLALWEAGRTNIPVTSPLAGRPLFHPRAVISVAGAGTLDQFKGRVDQICGHGVFDHVVGPSASDTWPDRLLPYRIPIRLIVGARDEAVPPPLVEGFADAARAHGDDVQLTVIPDADHGDPLRPDKRAFHTTMDVIWSALGGKH